MNTIIGTKDHMDQAFVENVRTPVTVINAGPCVVTQIKNQDKDGYWAVQFGFGEKKLKHTSKQLQGHLKNVIKEEKAPRYIQEVRFSEEPELAVGDVVSISDIFAAGDVIEVTGISKGKGFAGGVKRWNFRGGSKTHGQSDRHRAPGSIGQGTSPGRIWKGKKMAGRMGQDTITIKNMKVVGVDADTNQLMVSGPVPGSKGTLITITRISEKQVVETPQVEAQQEDTQTTETQE